MALKMNFMCRKDSFFKSESFGIFDKINAYRCWNMKSKKLQN